MAKQGENLVILIGNIGADPENRETNGGTSVTSFRIATSETWKDKQTGEKKKKTEWHPIKAFDKLADIAAEYASKGRKVYVRGSLRHSEYTDNIGIKRYATEVVADEIQLLDAPRSSQQSAGAGDDE